MAEETQHPSHPQGDPAKLTPAQMERWCKDVDNWAFCDAMSFTLFDRSPHAWVKVTEWSTRRNEFEKRTAFALLWSLTVHDKRAGDEPFIQGLALIEREADDGRHFVKRATNMALRAIGKRNTALNAAASSWRGVLRPRKLRRHSGSGRTPSGTHEPWRDEASRRGRDQVLLEVPGRRSVSQAFIEWNGASRRKSDQNVT